MVGLSILSGAHMTLLPKVTRLLRERGLDDVLVTAGGIIPDDDIPALEEAGVAAVFGPGNHDRGGGGLHPEPRPAARGVSPAEARAAELADAAVAGDRRALARLLTAVENRTPTAEVALRRLYPRYRAAHLVGITGAPGRRQEHARRGAHRGGARVRAGRWRSWRSTRRLRSRAAPSSATASACRRTRRTTACSSGAWPRAGTRAAWPPRARAPPPCSTPPASTSSCSRPSAPARARSRSPPRPTRRWSSRHPRWATRSRRSRPACWRWPTSWSSTRATDRAPSGRRPSCGRCSTSTVSPRVAAADGASAPGDVRAARPRPKRPEVLITTASTGEGVPALLAALDRHRVGRP